MIHETQWFVARSALLGEDTLAFPLSDHVACDDVTHDAGDEHIAARLGDEPAPPFELIECGVQRLSRQIRGAADSRCRHALAENCRGDERVLGRLRQTAKTDTD